MTKASTTTFDIVVYGSTSGAVATSIQAARLGRSVVLVSPHEHIGGIQVNGLGSTDIDNQAEFQNSTTLGGLNLEYHRRISKHYGRLDYLDNVVKDKTKDADVWRFEARVAEKIVAEWLAEEPLLCIYRDVYLEESNDAVKMQAGRLQSVRLSNGKTITGRMFVDASYEGDLLAAAGISTTRGRESRNVYNESLAGVRIQTPYRQITVPLDPYIVPGDPSSGLLYGISPEPFGTPGEGDKHLQAYSYRLPLTENPANRVPLEKPPNFNAAWYELHRRYFRAGGSHYCPIKRLPGSKTDLIGSEGALSTDLLGMNDEWPVATRARRLEILEETRNFTIGLVWFFANDPAVPESYRTAWAAFGYCRDEFPDNGHFPRQLYVRDGRRLVSDYVITEHTATQGGPPQVDDPVAVAFWPTDTHSVRRVLRDGRVHNEGFVFKDGHRWRPFGISYRALVPKRNEADNVLTATCPSSSHVGYGEWSLNT